MTPEPRLQLVQPIDVPTGGEFAGPPPEARPLTRHQWVERVAQLDAHPGVWIRWPYSQSAAGHARNRYISKTDPELYQFVSRLADGRWWLYGIRLAPTTDTDPTETTTCPELS